MPYEKRLEIQDDEGLLEQISYGIHDVYITYFIFNEN